MWINTVQTANLDENKLLIAKLAEWIERMVNVRVFVKSVSAENFWEIGKTLPSVQIATNLNVVGINKKGEKILEVPFVFTINYNHAVAQISFKGLSHLTGDKEELERIIKGHKEKKPPLPIIL